MTSNQHATWVLITNSNDCRIYQYIKKPHQLILIKEIKHPENKLRDTDLTSDKPGHYSTSSSARGAFSQPTDPKEIKIEDFSRSIAKELDSDRNTNAYEKLIVIAPPHMNGLLFQHINKHVQDLIVHNIKKDLLQLNENELLEFLHTHT